MEFRIKWKSGNSETVFCSAATIEEFRLAQWGPDIDLAGNGTVVERIENDTVVETTEVVPVEAPVEAPTKRRSKNGN
jgi:hypothetical protein